MKERLKELRKHLGLSQRAFCINLGMKQSTYASFETGERELKDAYIKLICQTYKVNEDWLKNGDGSMLHKEPTDMTKELLKIFDILSPIYQEYLLKQTKELLEIQSKEEKSLKN